MDTAKKLIANEHCGAVLAVVVLTVAINILVPDNWMAPGAESTRAAGPVDIIAAFVESR